MNDQQWSVNGRY